MTPIAHQILILLGFILVLTLVGTSGSLIACLAFRIKVDEVKVFYGKPVLTIRTPLCPVAVGFLPCGGFVSFDEKDFDTRPFVVRSVVVLGGAFATMLLAGVLLRIDAAGYEFAHGFSQIIRGALAPEQQGTLMVRDFFERTNESLIRGCGLFAAKFAALNMLPIPPLTGGRFLGEILPHRSKGRLWVWCNVFGAVLSYSVILCWLLALINHWRHL